MFKNKFSIFGVQIWGLKVCGYGEVKVYGDGKVKVYGDGGKVCGYGNHNIEKCANIY